MKSTVFASLTDELLELSRPIQPEHHATDLEEVLQEVLCEQLETLSRAGVNPQCHTSSLPQLPLDRGANQASDSQSGDQRLPGDAGGGRPHLPD